MSGGKEPLRKCVGCGQMIVKSRLLRVTKGPGGFLLDVLGKQPGRGAYVCAQDWCVASAKKHRGFERSYKGSFPKELYDEILKEVTNDGD